MGASSATTRAVAAAIAAVAVGLPAAAIADDGGSGSSAGGGATYYEASQDQAGAISLAVRRGAWIGKTTRIRGKAKSLEGRIVAVERRTARSGWVPVASTRVRRDGTFSTAWKPESAGRQELRAVSTGASSAERGGARASSAVRAVIVYKAVMATWYGPGFYGNRTACGQTLTTRTQGVAHKTLPCGTRIAVTYNGRSTVVPVIDRGPYAAGMSYDLTSATAQRLGVTQTSRIGAVALTR